MTHNLPFICIKLAVISAIIPLYFDIEDLCIVNFVNFLDELILKYIKHFLADDVHFLLDFLAVLSDQVQVLGALILFLVLDCLDRVPGCSLRAIVIFLGY